MFQVSDQHSRIYEISSHTKSYQWYKEFMSVYLRQVFLKKFVNHALESKNYLS